MKKNYLWASAHTILPEQREELEKDGQIFFLVDIDNSLQNRLNSSSSNRDELMLIAQALIRLCNLNDYKIVQPSGSLAFQFILGQTLEHERSKAFNGYAPECTVTTLYAHSERISVEESQPDGSVVKKSIFRHQKFICV